MDAPFAAVRGLPSTTDALQTIRDSSESWSDLRGMVSLLGGLIEKMAKPVADVIAAKELVGQFKHAQAQRSSDLGDEFWDDHEGNAALRVILAAVERHEVLVDCRTKIRSVVEHGLAKLDQCLTFLFEDFPADDFASQAWCKRVCKGDWQGRPGLLDPGCDMSGVVYSRGFGEALQQAIDTVTGSEDDVLIEQAWAIKRIMDTWIGCVSVWELEPTAEIRAGTCAVV
eukprot:3649391-Pyramimonas_sp.AAC.1